MAMLNVWLYFCMKPPYFFWEYLLHRRKKWAAWTREITLSLLDRIIDKHNKVQTRITDPNGDESEYW